jgi:hypothetical protein
MVERSRVIRLFLVGARSAARRRADSIIDGLAARRPVSDGTGEWFVIYGTAEVSEAMEICEADLFGIDPGWIEILDFETLRAPVALGAGFG